MVTVTELINSTVNVGYCCFGKENICYKCTELNYSSVITFNSNIILNYTKSISKAKK